MKDSKQQIVDKVIKAMEKGYSWKSGLPNSAPLFQNTNAKSKAMYQGINQFILSIELLEKGYTNNTWATYKQIKDLGHQVNKGEKGTRICFYKNLKIKDKETDEEKNIPMLRLFTVFNISQTDMEVEDNLKFEPTEKETIEIAENFIPKDAKIKIVNSLQPYYSLTYDEVVVPDRKYYDTIERYYSAMFHELGHWTGAKHRLNRDMKQQLESYSREELVAELTSSIILAKLGLRTQEILENQGAYLKSWITALKDNPEMLFYATSRAWKAVEYIKNN